MSLQHGITEINRLEALALGDSLIHRLHPRAKLLTSIAYIGIVISFPPYNVSGLMPFLLYPAVLMPLSGTPYKPLGVRLLTVLPFSLLGGLSNLLMIRETAFLLGTFDISFGMISFVSLMLKTLLTVFGALILIATTSFIEIGSQLTILGLPKIMGLQLVMTYRYLSVLLGEAASMFTAYTLRGADQKGIKMEDMGSFLGQLILRSFDRAERVYQAMKCRGFQGMYHGSINRPWRLVDYGYTLGILGALLGLRFFNLSLFLARVLRQL
jgi:cobalt/nickel transport system permease protein